MPDEDKSKQESKKTVSQSESEKVKESDLKPRFITNEKQKSPKKKKN